MEDFFFEDLDCDHFSVKIPTQYLARLAQFYQLSAKSIVDIKDDRVRDCIVLTMPPLVVSCKALKRALLDSMLQAGIVVVPNPDPRVLIKSAGRAVDANLLIHILLNVSVTEVFVYGYGMKTRSFGFITELDEACRAGGSQENVFDVGRTIVDSDVIICQAPGKAGRGPQSWNFPYLTAYKLFATLGGGFGSVEFRAEDNESRMKIYPRFTHCLKATVADKLWIPEKQRTCGTFSENYRAVVQDLSPLPDSILGGVRIEATVKAPTFSSAREKAFSFFGLQRWVERGLHLKRVNPREVLQLALRCIDVLDQSSLFHGRYERVTTASERQICVDAVNLIGKSLPHVFGSQVDRVPIEGDLLENWSAVLRPAEVHPSPSPFTGFDWNQMGSRIRWRKCINSAGYTLN
jgi:hypothetical protein